MSGSQTDTLLAQAAERAVELAVLGGRQGRRAFIERVGAATAGAVLASSWPSRWASTRSTASTCRS